MNKKQITFSGSMCMELALDWLQNLEKCFTIKRASVEKYVKKGSWWNEDKCRLKVQYQ